MIVAGQVELRTGVLMHVADARIGVMGIDVARIKLGVVGPDGSEHVAWYAEGEEVAASGRTWRVSRIRRLAPGEDTEIVAVLTDVTGRRGAGSPEAAPTVPR